MSKFELQTTFAYKYSYKIWKIYIFLFSKRSWKPLGRLSLRKLAYGFQQREIHFYPFRTYENYSYLSTTSNHTIASNSNLMQNHPPVIEYRTAWIKLPCDSLRNKQVTFIHSDSPMDSQAREPKRCTIIHQRNICIILPVMR